MSYVHFVFVYLKLICVTYILYRVLLMIVMSGVVISYDRVSSNRATSVPNTSEFQSGHRNNYIQILDFCLDYKFQYIHIFAVNAFVVRVCN